MVSFQFGWFFDPIFTGDYPLIMREQIDLKCKAEGLQTSRLPRFSPAWQQKLKGSWDFLGLNYYAANLVRHEIGNGTGWAADMDANRYEPEYWPKGASEWLKVTPLSFRKILGWIKNTYGNPPLYVTENGFSDREVDGPHDPRRADYFVRYINQMLKAVLLDGCNVKGYTAWSLMDNFEWLDGYS